MAYTDQTNIQNYLHRTLTAGEITFLTLLLPTIKTWIDNKTSSTFDQVAATTRYFDGGVQHLDIDPCNTITAVVAVNDDLSDSYIYTNNTEYVASPQNETVKRELRKRYGCFPSGAGSIAVTAMFTEYDGGVPQDIQLIATIIAGEVLNQGSNSSSNGTVSKESLEGHTIEYDVSATTIDGIADDNPNVKSLLAQRRELFVG